MMYGNFTERELDAFWMGVESEQTRIIKLLEETIIKSNQELNVENGDWYPAAKKMQSDFIKAIALIKEEQKSE